MWEGRPLQWVFAEEANGIGMQLAKEILGGKYEPVLTTHIDKGHIYNHLIFNAVSFSDQEYYHSKKRSYHEIRRASGHLCRESCASLSSARTKARATLSIRPHRTAPATRQN